MTKIMDLPAHQRPREKLLAQGAENLKDKELLAILLRIGRQGKSAIEIADDILKKYKLSKILNLKVDQLKKIKGLGADKIATILAAFIGVRSCISYWGQVLYFNIFNPGAK